MSKFIEIPEIETLEDYLLQAAIYAVSLQGLIAVQKNAMSKGLFNLDETENAETVIYSIHRTLLALDDQVKLVCQRSPIEWADLVKSVIAKIDNKDTKPKKVANGKSKPSNGQRKIRD